MFDVSLKNEMLSISVVVITYQSAATVIETLDSIVSQTYGAENIELIISDDGSQDETVKIINTWLTDEKNKFRRVIFFANKVNGGVSKNCNMAWKVASSDWIKTIAGDDVLLPNCLADNMGYILNSKCNEVAVLFSKMQLFCESDGGVRKNLTVLPSTRDQYFFELSSLEQFKYLQRQGISGAPSAFINRVKLANIGFADERFPMMEDHPLWFKLSKAGYQLKFMDKNTVLYRIADSISNSKSRLINFRYINEIISVEEQLVIPTLKSNQYLLKLRKRIWPRLAIRVAIIFNNKVTFFSKLVMAVVFTIKPAFLSGQLFKVLDKS